jgi:dienelactone hydrolase
MNSSGDIRHFRQCHAFASGGRKHEPAGTKALARSEMRARIVNGGSVPIEPALSAEQWTQQIKREVAQRAEVVRAAGIKAERSRRAPMEDEVLSITRDLVYGHATVHASTTPRLRPLKLDVYAAASAAPAGALRPALIMAFGGAFHRGNKEADEFNKDGHRNTPVSSYCRALASRGGVGFSIDYLLLQEDPDPGTTPVITEPERIPMGRVEVVRQLLGLPPATTRMVWAGIEAAADDMAAAFRFVQANAGPWGVDGQRIAVGGFSAGARTAINVAYAEGLPAAAVVSFSGFMADADLLRWVSSRQPGAPVCLFHGQADLPYIAQKRAAMREAFAAHAPGSQDWLVPGATHFYPHTAAAASHDGRIASVGEVVAAFLALTLG